MGSDEVRPLYPRERQLICDLVHGLIEEVRTDYLPDVGMGEAVDLIYTGMCAFQANVRKQPLTPHKLSETIGVPRRTVERRMAKLVARGLFKIDGRRRYLLDSHINHPRIVRSLRIMLALIQKTQEEMVKTRTLVD